MKGREDIEADNARRQAQYDAEYAEESENHKATPTAEILDLIDGLVVDGTIQALTDILRKRFADRAADYLERAYRAGQENMRERAAAFCDGKAKVWANAIAFGHGVRSLVIEEQADE